jgi:hypothetical protein
MKTCLGPISFVQYFARAPPIWCTIRSADLVKMFRRFGEIVPADLVKLFPPICKKCSADLVKYGSADFKPMRLQLLVQYFVFVGCKTLSDFVSAYFWDDLNKDLSRKICGLKIGRPCGRAKNTLLDTHQECCFGAFVCNVQTCGRMALNVSQRPMTASDPSATNALNSSCSTNDDMSSRVYT